MTLVQRTDHRGQLGPLRYPKLGNAVSGWLFVLPALLFYGAIVIVPTLQSVWYSLFDWNGVSPGVWVGFGNYVDFFVDPQVAEALLHALVLVFFFSLLPIALGLLSAALLSRGRRRGEGIFRWIIFLPQVLTSVVVAVVWKQVYAPDGPLNAVLRALGLGHLAEAWLGSFSFALPALGLVGTWTTTGLCTLLFVSGAMAIPTELYEAVRADGAGAIREFFTVTLPGLRPQIAVALTLTVLGALRAFDLIWLTTRGGPGTSTMTPALLLYSRAFTQSEVGAGSAIGVVVAIVSLVIALVIVRLTERRD